jgi:hypothetical protein
VRPVQSGPWRLGLWPDVRVLAVLVIAAFASCESDEDPGDNSSALCSVVCETGKPCGDSCIAKEKTCTGRSGCACDEFATASSFQPL